MGSAATSAVMGRALLISKDTVAIRELSDGMQQFAIAPELCEDVSLAVRLLNRKRFEAVIIDLADEPTDEILQRIRHSPSNSTAVTFVLSDSGRSAAFPIQPNFVMQKPLSAGVVGRTLKAAFGLIVRERRRSFRCPVTAHATVYNNGAQCACNLVNVSEGGLALSEMPALAPGSQVKVRFALPGHTVCVNLEAEICWYDQNGRAGLRTVAIAPDHRSLLQEWLTAKLEEDLPETVARQFRKE